MRTWAVVEQTKNAVVLRCECHIPTVVEGTGDVDRAMQLAEERHHEFHNDTKTRDGWGTIRIIDYGSCVACSRMREHGHQTCPACTEEAVKLLLLSRVQHPHSPVDEPEDPPMNRCAMCDEPMTEQRRLCSLCREQDIEDLRWLLTKANAMLPHTSDVMFWRLRFEEWLERKVSKLPENNGEE